MSERPGARHTDPTPESPGSRGGGKTNAGPSTPAWSDRLLARNSVLNLLGLGLPLLIALIAIPRLIHGLGTERFGALTLVWIAIGYFSVFDLGLGRALTQLVADRLGGSDADEIGELVWTAQVMVLVLGAIGGLLLVLIGPWLVDSVLQIPADLRSEVRTSFLLLGLGLPWVLGTTAWRGYLEAEQRFGLINGIRVPLGILTYAGPLAVLPFSTSLVPVVVVLVAGRAVAWGVHLGFSAAILSRASYRPAFSPRAVRPLLRFGSWMTVSNVISPIMVYLDRFLIGSLLTMAAVAYYVTPYEVVTRLWLIPSAVLAVTFPAFAASFGRDAERWAALIDRSARAIFLALFPITLLLVTFAFEALSVWVGAEFAARSQRVLQWLAVGVFVNSLGQVAFAAVQGAGRPDLTAKLHLAELPIYAGVLWWLLRTAGIEGVAVAWTARVALDTVLLLVACGSLGGNGVRIGRTFGRLLVPALLAFGVAAAAPDIVSRLVVAGLGLVTYLTLAWCFVLTAHERSSIRRWGHWLPSPR